MHQRRIFLLAITSFILIGLLVFFVVRGSTGPTKQTSQTTSLPGRFATNEPMQTKGTPTTTLPAKVLATQTATHLSGYYLNIASIGVNAPIEDVGLAKDGSLAVPASNPWDGVGWYQYGPRPGAKGSAVIDGHLDRPGGSPAVFWNLKNLHIGDIVDVTRSGQRPLHFGVIALKYYAPTASTSGIFSNTSGTFLNLITCAGTWIPSQHQTTLRLVVYTIFLG
jgi:sortase (surface protein transpeptidase)